MFSSCLNFPRLLITFSPLLPQSHFPNSCTAADRVHVIQRQELSDVRSENEFVLLLHQQQRRAGLPWDDNRQSIRGLGSLGQRVARILAVVNHRRAVLGEQSRLRGATKSEGGIQYRDCSESLYRVSVTNSRPNRDRALAEAKLDAAAVAVSSSTGGSEQASDYDEASFHVKGVLDKLFNWLEETGPSLMHVCAVSVSQ